MDRVDVGTDWLKPLMACPRCTGSLSAVGAKLKCASCGPVGSVEGGIYRFGVQSDDEATRWYVGKGGSNFHERMRIPFTMSSLDAGVYHSYLEALRPTDNDALVVDVGAADGRNTEPFLKWGCRRVIATDVSVASLARLRDRVAAEHPEWLPRLALIEGDARQLPLVRDCADLIVCTEALCCLNEGYFDGLSSCARILKPGPRARLLLSERSWEGGLVVRLLYSGVASLVEMKDSRDLMDGPTAEPLRTRTFTEDELVGLVQKAGLTVLERKGTPMLSLLFGYLNGKGILSPDDQVHLPQVRGLMSKLGECGFARRTHTIVAQKAAA